MVETLRQAIDDNTWYVGEYTRLSRAQRAAYFAWQNAKPGEFGPVREYERASAELEVFQKVCLARNAARRQG